jgi:hypothetical protein
MRAASSTPQTPAQGSAGQPFHEDIPRQVMALAAWAGFWMLAEWALRRRGLDDRRALLAFLALLAPMALGGVLWARGWLFRLFTSVRFAVAQGGFLAAAVLLATALRAGGLPRRLWFCALLAVLAAAMLTVTWKRRPYDLARAGFLLVHVAPALVLAGALWGRLGGVQAWGGLASGATLDSLYRVGEPGLVRLPGFRLGLERRGPRGPEVLVLDPEGRELARKCVSPGDPLRFRGYEIRPSVLRPDDAAAAGIEVLRDPGRWLVQAGLASLLLGCAWMFYLKPVLKRRRAEGGKP